MGASKQLKLDHQNAQASLQTDPRLEGVEPLKLTTFTTLSADSKKAQASKNTKQYKYSPVQSGCAHFDSKKELLFRGREIQQIRRILNILKNPPNWQEKLIGGSKIL